MSLDSCSVVSGYTRSCTAEQARWKGQRRNHAPIRVVGGTTRLMVTQTPSPSGDGVKVAMWEPSDEVMTILCTGLLGMVN